jgi:hypothetical protein
MPNLSELQRRFSEWLQGALPVNDATSLMDARNFQRGLGVYHYAYSARIGDSLKEDFPAILRWIGTESFDSIVRPFLAAYPSNYRSLAEVSRHFPDFLDEIQHPEDPQFLPALAHLEWAMVRARFADSQPARDVKPFAEVGTQNVLQTTLVLNPSLVCLTSEWPVDKLLTPKGQLAFREAVRLAVFRNQSGIQIQRLRPRQWELLLLIENGMRTDKLLLSAQKARVTSEQIQKWFKQWAEKELIVGFR